MSNTIERFIAKLPIIEIEKRILTLPQGEIPLKETWSGGIYIREIIMPKGTLLVGKRHRHKTCNMVISGEVEVYLSSDMHSTRMKAPRQFESGENVKKLIFAYENSVFMTFHATKERDPDKIEECFIIPENEFLQIKDGARS